MGLSRETEGEDRTTRPAATTLVAGFSAIGSSANFTFHAPSFTFFSLSRALFLTLHVSTFRPSNLGGEIFSNNRRIALQLILIYLSRSSSTRLSLRLSPSDVFQFFFFFFFRIKEFCVFTKFIRHPWRLIIDYRIFLNWSRQNERTFSKWN